MSEAAEAFVQVVTGDVCQPDDLQGERAFLCSWYKGFLQRGFEGCAQIGLRNNEFMIVGSTALYMSNILPPWQNQGPKDLDILVDPDKFDELESLHGSEPAHTNGLGGSVVKINHEGVTIEISKFYPALDMTQQQIKASRTEIGGLYTIGPPHEMQFCLISAREKDIQRCADVKREHGRLFLSSLLEREPYCP